MAEKPKKGRNTAGRNNRNENENKGGKQDTSNRGFATLDEEKQREIASKGSRASQGGGRKR